MTGNDWFPEPYSFSVSSFSELKLDGSEKRKIAVSLDLDLFSGSAQIAEDVHLVLDFICNFQNTEYLVIAISNPYLSNSEELNLILHSVFTFFLEDKRISTIRFEPFLRQGNDMSYKIAELQEEGVPDPYFSLNKIEYNLKQLWSTHREQISVLYNALDWVMYLDQ